VAASLVQWAIRAVSVVCGVSEQTAELLLWDAVTTQVRQRAHRGEGE
jgi:hypothetical protein